jgi:hypothetical protein
MCWIHANILLEASNDHVLMKSKNQQHPLQHLKNTSERNFTMKKYFIIISAVFGGFFFLSTTCAAIPVTGFISSVTGKDMVGMNITVEYGDGLSHTSTWENLEGDYSKYSGVIGDWGTLLFDDDVDTFFGEWYLSAYEGYLINSLTINGGNTVFDIKHNGVGTPGSELGYWEGLLPDFNSDPTPSGQSTIDGVTFDWTFSNAVYFAGTSPDSAIGDVYNTLSFNFQPNEGGGLTDIMSWELDTDLVKPVPEPSAILLFGAGLIGIGALARRKKYNQ